MNILKSMYPLATKYLSSHPVDHSGTLPRRMIGGQEALDQETLKQYNLVGQSIHPIPFLTVSFVYPGASPGHDSWPVCSFTDEIIAQ